MSGAATYVLVYFEVLRLGLAPVVAALLVSAAAMLAGGYFGRPEAPVMLQQIETLHEG